ncbi:CAP domain-containing protein [Haloarcula sp. Atlit-120R]|uniref:CAP domain-containing protein n=1 Tax=Haloarcula sp. Atlit-120R TaxID=2282135 RepID=UPI000EF18600|nr:CAP domain-containing protein [Haloarcula sp. Atlit-120R]RLM32881.1 hypothetical protein DVK01_19530 [Haloarcula sp. Atlit-120R]
MSPNDWAEKIREDMPGPQETIQKPGGDGEQENQPTIAVLFSECDKCGMSDVLSYHHEQCGSPIVHLENGWRCGGCGARISPHDTCANCGASLDIDNLEVPIDVSHSADPNEIEAAIHEKTNQQRSNHGIGTLQYSPHLSTIALQHSRDMAHQQYFDHTSPNGATTKDRYRQFGHDIRKCGENIALTYPTPMTPVDEVAGSVVDDWMESPGHRENILREQFDREGIGVYLTQDGAIYTTQNFY